MSSTAASANRQIARSAAPVMLAFILSQVAGLVRQILVTRTFGTGSDIDAFNGATAIPNLIFNIIAGGALASAFVPTFTGLLAKDERRAAWRLASSILNTVLLILVILSLVSALLAPQITTLLVPKFSPEKQALTADLLRILLITSSIFGVSGILSGILNAHQRFFFPALASSMYWVGLIIGLIFFVPGQGIFGLAWGAVLGAVLHLVVQLPDFFKLPNRFITPTLGLNNPAVREIFLLMGPRLIGVATVQINALVMPMIASGMPDGSLTALNYAFPIMTMPLVVIGSAIGFVVLPTFSAQAARGEFDQMRSSIVTVLRAVLFLAIPATFGLILLRVPLITFLFQSGRFTSQSTEWTAWALLWFTTGLVFHSLLEVLARAFYALHDTKTPALTGAVAMLLNVGFSFLFSALFAQWGLLALGGLAFANSAATALETTTLLILLNRRMQGLDSNSLLRAMLASLASAAGMGAALAGWLAFSSGLSAFLRLAGGLVIGGAVYALLMLALRVPEVKQAAGWGQRKLMAVMRR